MDTPDMPTPRYRRRPLAPVSDVQSLRDEYDRLARLVPTLKRDSAEFKAAMEAKRRAFMAWHAASQT
jgi:hypothetical protein